MKTLNLTDEELMRNVVSDLVSLDDEFQQMVLDSDEELNVDNGMLVMADLERNDKELAMEFVSRVR